MSITVMSDDWRTSSYSNSGACVEAASGVLVRDTKDRGGPVLAFSPDTWTRFTEGLRRGEPDPG